MSTTPNQYDSDLSKKYEKVSYNPDFPHQFMIYETWLEELGDLSGQKVLDLGCGSGTSSRALVNLGASVVGVDISEFMIADAKVKEQEHPLGIKYFVGDASVIQTYENGNFDTVAAGFLLHYSTSREMLDNMIKNIALNLKPGGRFVSLNMNPDYVIVKPELGVSHSAKWIDSEWVDGSRIETTLWDKTGKEICKFFNFYWSKKTYEELFKKAGFDKVEWIKIRMPEICKKEKNWQYLEKTNNIIVIKATKTE